MARSSRSSGLVGFTVMLVFAAGSSLAAHRVDEYLQAARVAIDPDRVQIDLDLTPGIGVAEGVLADIDRDRDGSISTIEASAYVDCVLSTVTVDIDGIPLRPRVTDATFRTVDAIRKGEGTIRIRIAAPVTRMVSGAHHLHYRNALRPDIGVYLANALVPASARVAITDQLRDVDQRDFDVAYLLQPRRESRAWLVAVSALIIGLSAAVALAGSRITSLCEPGDG